MALKDKLGGGFGGGSQVATAMRNTSHYEAQVNKGKLNMGTFTSTLNSRWDSGWKFNFVFEQDGNTVVVWERRDDADAAATFAAAQSPPVGWYLSPDSSGRMQWWDGDGWTEKYQDA